MLTEEQRGRLAKKIRRLALSTRRVVLSRLLGAYRSAFQGRGMDFSQVRAFAEGDDVRQIDWNVTARMNSTFVKTFHEEHALTVLLIVDVSSSMNFGSSLEHKRELAAEVAALISFAALESGDTIGLLLFAEDVELYLPPNNRERHVMRILREILVPGSPSGKSNFDTMLHFLGHLQKRPDLCFFISDLKSPLPAQPLAVAARRSDWIVIQIEDPLEKKLPPVGLVHFIDCETKQDCYVDTSNEAFQRNFAAKRQEWEETCIETLRKCRIDRLVLSTDQPYEHTLESFFLKRKRKVR